jgi:hypothetical protein
LKLLEIFIYLKLLEFNNPGLILFKILNAFTSKAKGVFFIKNKKYFNPSYIIYLIIKKSK